MPIAAAPAAASLVFGLFHVKRFRSQRITNYSGNEVQATGQENTAGTAVAPAAFESTGGDRHATRQNVNKLFALGGTTWAWFSRQPILSYARQALVLDS